MELEKIKEMYSDEISENIHSMVLHFVKDHGIEDPDGEEIEKWIKENPKEYAGIYDQVIEFYRIEMEKYEEWNSNPEDGPWHIA